MRTFRSNLWHLNHQPLKPAPAAISVSFVLPIKPSRSETFRTAIASLLHAGFAFGLDLPGHIVYSHDLAGEQYVETRPCAAGTLLRFEQAKERLAALAPYYNHSIGLSFHAPHGSIEVCGRVYDEPGVLVFSLDFAETAWRRLAPERAADIEATGLINAGRILFTLLPVDLLLIGPSALLQGLPVRLTERRLHAVPIAMLARGAYPASRRGTGAAPLYEEQLSRGRLVVRDWDAAKALPVKRAAARARTYIRTRG